MNSIPLIITAALVGAELSRKEQPYLPLTADEIIQSALEAIDAGAAIIHLHVRDAQGHPTCDEKIFAEVIQKIRKQSRAILQVSTGGAVGDSEAARFQPLLANPDMASLSTGSINFGNAVFLNPTPFVEKLASEILQKNIKPEMEIFDVAMLENGIRLLQKGLVKSPGHFQFVLGVPGALSANERNLKFLVDGLPEEATWSLAAIGRSQFSMMEYAIKWGGHCRVGFEDNIYLEKGVLAKTNAELVAKVVALAKKYSRPVASVEEAREMLSLDEFHNAP
ncbi:MAG: 3-keto-5-aminohexanoate cleavage protein [Deltaproteobacteria bacterium]|nr:3-keto-5-aminohexanoate cleavage protein [Deltaproteobacteria bacterium]